MPRSCSFLYTLSLTLLSLILLSGTGLSLEFKPYGRGDFDQVAQLRENRPRIIHYWSVTCPACIAELGQWTKFINEHRDIDIIFINTDDDEDRERAAARLEKNGLSRATHYGFSDSFVEKLYYEVDKSWRGELPFTVLISTNGPRVNVTGALDDPHFVAWLNQLNGMKK